MTATGHITYLTKTASEQTILLHLSACDASFVPPLSTRVNLAEYSKKLFRHAVTFEAWSDQTLAGLIAAYFNETEKRAFITSVSVLSGYKEHGVASALLQHCKDYAKAKHYAEIALEVNKENIPAVRFYTKYQFAQTGVTDDVWTMSYQVNQHQ